MPKCRNSGPAKVKVRGETVVLDLISVSALAKIDYREFRDSQYFCCPVVTDATLAAKKLQCEKHYLLVLLNVEEASAAR